MHFVADVVLLVLAALPTLYWRKRALRAESVVHPDAIILPCRHGVRRSQPKEREVRRAVA